MPEIVPPRPVVVERRILRRPKAYRRTQWAAVLVVLAVALLLVRSLSGGSTARWLVYAGLISLGLAAVAGISAMSYFLREKPREVVIRAARESLYKPYVIHVGKRDDDAV